MFLIFNKIDPQNKIQMASEQGSHWLSESSTRWQVNKEAIGLVRVQQSMCSFFASLACPYDTKHILNISYYYITMVDYMNTY